MSTAYTTSQELPRELYHLIFQEGCMYHKDDGKCPGFPSVAYYRVSGDVWCQGGVSEARAEGLVFTTTAV
jgi:hypothetical protein